MAVVFSRRSSAGAVSCSPPAAHHVHPIRGAAGGAGPGRRSICAAPSPLCVLLSLAGSGARRSSVSPRPAVGGRGRATEPPAPPPESAVLCRLLVTARNLSPPRAPAVPAAARQEGRMHSCRRCSVRGGARWVASWVCLKEDAFWGYFPLFCFFFSVFLCFSFVCFYCLCFSLKGLQFFIVFFFHLKGLQLGLVTERPISPVLLSYFLLLIIS